MEKRYYLAIDIGASSGRHIIGWYEPDGLKTEEVYRFPNGMEAKDGHLFWDMDSMVEHVRTGIEKAKEAFGTIASLSIDTWGCDYMLLKDGEVIRPSFAYRDKRTLPAMAAIDEQIPYEELYRKIGMQRQPFNSIYQLYADKTDGYLDEATDFLMIPEYLLYRLIGVKTHEYTNATTTGLVNTDTGQYDPDIIAALGFPARLFQPLEQPGTVVGEYEGIRCVLCPSHDTAAAVEGIPMEGNQVYISSGTWSLLGIKAPEAIKSHAAFASNWTNEGGVGYIRFLKNIMGMWIANELRRELCPEKSYGEIVAEAEASDFDELVDANAPELLAPDSMKQAFDEALGHAPEKPADYFRCAYRSLALCYKNAITDLEKAAGREFDQIYIVGGGAKNLFLNRLTEEMTGKQVVALPIEATTLGNLKWQREADL